MQRMAGRDRVSVPPVIALLVVAICLTLASLLIGLIFWSWTAIWVSLVIFYLIGGVLRFLSARGAKCSIWTSLGYGVAWWKVPQDER